jgi:Holliday junction resolvase-like predicted endonuclease
VNRIGRIGKDLAVDYHGGIQQVCARFDVIFIDGWGKIRHFINAFTESGIS